MPRKLFTNEQIAFAPRQAGNGATMDEAWWLYESCTTPGDTIPRSTPTAGVLRAWRRVFGNGPSDVSDLFESAADRLDDGRPPKRRIACPEVSIIERPRAGLAFRPIRPGLATRGRLVRTGKRDEA